jgi:hypothetical protein
MAMLSGTPESDGHPVMSFRKENKQSQQFPFS